MSNSQRRKGADGERELAGILRDQLGEIVERTGFAQADCGGFDLVLPGIGIEVKRMRRVTDYLIEKAWKQNVEQMEAAHCAGVLAYRGDQQEWHFVCPQISSSNGLITWDQRLELTETRYLAGFCDWYRGFDIETPLALMRIAK